MKRTILFLLAGQAASHADVVSWNYDRYGTVSGTRVAGVEAVANWNNSWPGNPTTNLIDDTGTATTLDIAYSSFNTWTVNNPQANPGQDADTTYNRELLNGYLNAGNAGWGPNPTYSRVVISEIPYPNYHIIVYFSSDTAGREGDVTDGTTTYSFNAVGPASVTGANAVLAQTTDTAGTYATAANYAVFSGLTGNSKTITVQMRDDGEWGGIAGFQVVADLGSVPEFGLQPVNQSAAVSSNATFSASAAADPAPTYQWEYSADGTTGWTAVTGGTEATLNLIYVQLSDEGYYRVTATNDNGSDTSDVAFLDVFHATPQFFQQPASTYAVEGSTVQLSADATTYGTPSCQWYKDGNPLSGETNTTLTLTGVDSGDNGSYFLRVTDDIEPNLSADSQTVTVSTFPAWSGLVSHDPFDTAAGYTLGELPLQNPAVTGYDGAWTDVDFGDAEPAVQSGSLSYPDPLYLGSSGDQIGKAADAAGIGAANSGRAWRKLAPAQVVAGNTTGVRYLSFLYRNGNENAAGNPTTYSTLALYQSDATDANRNFEAGVADDALGANLFFRVNNTETGNLGVPLDSDVHLMVVKFDLSDQSASDHITVWLDPQLGAGEPAGGVAVSNRDVAFDRMVFSDYASNSSAWDEVRWGSTFDSVTLNPNPADDFAAWIANYPGVGAQTGFTQDADGDGIANGVENLFGTNPGVANAGISQVAASGNTVTFRHPQNASPASDVSAAYEWSADLVTFHADGASDGGATVSFTASPDTPLAGTTTVTAAITGTVPAKLFFRLKALQTP